METLVSNFKRTPKSLNMPTNLLFRIPYFLTLFSFLLFFSACENGLDGPKGPVSFELVTVDYITGNSAFFTADFSGQMSKVDEKGFCWSTQNPPNTNDNIVIFEPVVGLVHHTATGFAREKTYYMRAYYKSKGIIYYSETQSFTTTTTLSDRDNNVYGVVKIGKQLWMAENLKAITYNNGDSIADGTGRGNYSQIPMPRFYFNYNDNIENRNIYGNLYTWYVVTDERNLCPPQWRVPDVADWEKLIGHLDALSVTYDDALAGVQDLSAIAGGMLRTQGTIEAGTGLWHAPNQGATNVTKMNVIPSGLRDPSGAFDGLGYNAAFWSYTENNAGTAMMFYSHFFNSGFHVNSFSKSSGYAVRCVRNTP
jgi:uncharacterized protein (TIGR02145 family)